MALQRIPGVNNHWLHDFPRWTTPPALGSILLDAAADRITMVGGFTHPDGVSKTVDGVEFPFGTVGKANGSTMQVSLQNVDLGNGPVIREDGTPDQTLTIANADAGFVSNAWYGGDFDAAGTRTLAIGELVAVVFQFGSFVAGDSVNIRGLATVNSSNVLDNQNIVVANLTGTYAAQVLLSNVIFRCSDGTFGTLENAWPCTAVNTHAFNVGTGVADEYALGAQLPFPYQSNGMWAPSLLAGATFATEYLTYSGTTALQTTTMDHNALSANTVYNLRRNYPPQTHLANTLYRVAVRPTGTTNISVYSTDVNELGHMACLPGGSAFHLWTRLDQGVTWTPFTTRRLLAGIRLSAFDDGVQIGGERAFVGVG